MPTVYDAAGKKVDSPQSGARAQTPSLSARKRVAGSSVEDTKAHHFKNQSIKSGNRVAKSEHHHLSMPESVANEKPTDKSISAYVVKPNNIHFETQEREEKIVLLLRRHVVTNLGWIFMALIMLMVPVFFNFIFSVYAIPYRFRVVFIILWCLFVMAFVFEKFLSWYYNVFIITDERIVDVDFHSLLYKEVAQAKIDNIQDITFVMGGTLRAIYNFGTVYIQTAGEQREFDIDDVPHPNRVAKVLNELIIEEEKEKLEGRVR